MRLLRMSLLAASCSLAIVTTASATRINESFDGAWVDTSAAGNQKGLMVDYIPSANTFFFAFFTYDNAGEQVWLVGSLEPQAGVVDYADVEVTRVRGGRFSERGTPVSTVVGSVDLSIGCDAIALGFSPATGSGLTTAAFDFSPSQGLDSLGAGECSLPLAACPAGTAADGDACRLPNSITGALHLPAGKDYTIRGEVAVENGATLRIDPGVTLQGSSDTSALNYLVVKVGGRIYAEGTATQPIVFTGPSPTVGSWGGVAIAGRSTCNDGTSGTPCQFEANPAITYGGDQLDDNSGALRYVRIEYAGIAIGQDREFNALTLLGVGNGTVLEHVQTDHGKDDGFEFFGGSVDGRYLVCSNMGDDCFDFDQGYSGRIQYALAYQGDNADIGSDSNGVESDNDSSNFDKAPRTRPVIANLTLIGSANGNEGLRLRRGTGGNYYSTVVTGFKDRCLNLDDAGTFALGTAAQQGDALSFAGSFVGTCAGGAFEDNATDAYAVSAWYASNTSNRSGDPKLIGVRPAADSPLLGGGSVPADPFFVPGSYVGAFSGPRDLWTAGWTVNLPQD